MGTALIQSVQETLPLDAWVQFQLFSHACGVVFHQYSICHTCVYIVIIHVHHLGTL